MRKKGRKKTLQRLVMQNSLLAIVLISSMMFIGGLGNFDLTIQNNVFAQGVYINNIDVSLMTYQQAEQTISDHIQELYSKAHICLICNGLKTELNARDLGIILDYRDMLDEAFYYNKMPDDTKIEKYNKTVELSKGVYFGEGFFDKDVLYETINMYAQAYNIKAVDATVAVDIEKCVITITKDKIGWIIDTSALTDEVLQRINEEDFSDIEVFGQYVYPEVTECELKSNTVLIGECETKATRNTNRNTNIQLMCDVINGLVLPSGETLSLNELTGERTEEKGFKAAAVIVDGVSLEDQIGGGICQLSGTLYNAALLANMEIVERFRHSWPSSYLPIGLDATLNWNNKDLKIKNTSDMPIYILASFKNQKVKVQLYGKPLLDGMTIEIENDIEEVISYYTEITYTYNLSPGEIKTLNTPREGYKVKVYRKYIQDGDVVQTELISQDTYQAINKKVLIGRNIDKE